MQSVFLLYFKNKYKYVVFNATYLYNFTYSNTQTFARIENESDCVKDLFGTYTIHVEVFRTT